MGKNIPSSGDTGQSVAISLLHRSVTGANLLIATLLYRDTAVNKAIS